MQRVIHLMVLQAPKKSLQAYKLVVAGQGPAATKQSLRAIAKHRNHGDRQPSYRGMVHHELGRLGFRADKGPAQVILHGNVVPAEQFFAHVRKSLLSQGIALLVGRPTVHAQALHDLG